jgi:N-dimethylarginine dimethylaminohydrolase
MKVTAMNRLQPKARFLMCPPEHFAVTYAINPWMNPTGWAREAGILASAAREQWDRLHRTMRDLGAQIDLVSAAPGLPDLVFTANAAVVLDGKALLARFRHPQRQAEEPHFAAAFLMLKEKGLIDSIGRLPGSIVLEGAGDCVWDQTRNLFWMGYGQRSDAAARPVVEREFGVDVVPLQLADARFYHMDTALRPLPGGELIYYPNAFTAAGRAEIRRRVPSAKRIEIASDDARRFAANAVSIGDAIVLSGCSDNLRRSLEAAGYRVIATPLVSFQRSGGSAFCLTLRLDGRSSGMRAATGIAAA